jgi:hypothetical protein
MFEARHARVAGDAAGTAPRNPTATGGGWTDRKREFPCTFCF